MKIDKINLAIIKHLRDGRKSFNKIAEELNITENTVRSRVNRMTEAGLVEIVGTVDPDMLTNHNILYVGIKLDTRELVKKAEEFSKLKGVISASVVTGRFDVMLLVMLKKDFTLLDFLSMEIDKVDSIQTVETFVVYKNVNMQVPYIF
jgi:Lrp/AsnC family transcriptional regulator, regulator for asnA, asnC and gidA